MPNIQFHIANAAKKFDDQKIKVIQHVFSEASKKTTRLLDVYELDVIFFAVEDNYQLGIYGYTPNPYTVQIYIDTAFDNFSDSVLESTLLHEIHHAVRWRNPGYGKRLGEKFITEGLATLFEDEVMGIAPPYAKLKLKPEQIKIALENITSTSADHNEWFYGSKDIDNWFGYAYGYSLCKRYSTKVHKKASELVHIPADEILKSSNIEFAS